MGLLKVLVTGLFISILFYLPTSSLAQDERVRQSREVRISGKLVDEFGVPIQGAFIRLFWKCRGCSDQSFPGQRTGVSGNFFLTTETTLNKLTLFIDDKEPVGFWSPLFYLSEEDRSKLKLLKGVHFPTDKNGEQLGDMLAPYRYSKVIVDLKGLMPEESSTDWLGGLNMEVRDDKDRLVESGVLPKAAFDHSLSRLQIVLPVSGNGTEWRINLRLNGTSRVFKYRIGLKKLGCVFLSIIGGKQIQTPCGTNELRQ